MRIMGLDFGSKTVGVAISDELLITAQGIETIERKEENKLRRTLARIEALIVEYGIEEIVLGLPKNMNNSIGARAELTIEFKDRLERRTARLRNVLQDQRFPVAFLFLCHQNIRNSPQHSLFQHIKLSRVPLLRFKNQLFHSNNHVLSTACKLWAAGANLRVKNLFFTFSPYFSCNPNATGKR